MSTLVWGFGGLWLIARLWLEWRIDQSWLPGTADIREDYTNWAVPPPDALTPDGGRLWRLLHRVTDGGFLTWCLLVVIWLL